MNPQYLLTETHAIADIGKAGSSSLSSAILTQLHPDKVIIFAGHDPSNSPTHLGRSRIPRTGSPDLPVLIPVRDAVERFRSACSQSRIEDVDALLTKLENGEVLHSDVLAIDSFHFRPQSNYLYPDSTVRLYKFPEHFDAMGTDAGLTVPMPVINDAESNNPPKPDLTPDQLARVGVIYADDIALFESITDAGQELATDPAPVITPDPEPAYVPLVVAAWRIKAIAELQGLTASIDVAIEAIEDPATKVVASYSWKEGNEISRASSLIISMAAGLGLSDTDLDTMFISAAALPV